MAREPSDAKVVTYVPTMTKTWLDKEAAKQGLATSAYVRSLLLRMQNRAAA